MSDVRTVWGGLYDAALRVDPERAHLNLDDMADTDDLELRALVDAPLIGPAHAPAVLDGVTVEELARAAHGAYYEGEYWDEDTVTSPIERDEWRASVRAILSRIGVAIPRATIRAQVKMVAGRPTLTVKDDVPLPAQDGAWITLALLAEEE